MFKMYFDKFQDLWIIEEDGKIIKSFMFEYEAKDYYEKHCSREAQERKN